MLLPSVTAHNYRLANNLWRNVTEIEKTGTYSPDMLQIMVSPQLPLRKGLRHSLIPEDNAECRSLITGLFCTIKSQHELHYKTSVAT